MFTIETTVQLHDTDAAGLLFFARQFHMAHDCYQAMLEAGDMGFCTILQERDYILPIVHAEADYSQPLHVGQRLVVAVSAARIGTTSFILDYDIADREGESVGHVQTVHVCADADTRKKKELPNDLRKLLQQHLPA